MVSKKQAATLKKVMRGLNKASKTHAKQAKSIKKVVKKKR